MIHIEARNVQMMDTVSHEALPHLGEDDDDIRYSAISMLKEGGTTIKQEMIDSPEEGHTPKAETSKSVTPGELCSICGDDATGQHYGASACNGCKTFFRRVVLENRNFSCKNNGNCVIDKNHRCSCRHCRYKKCVIMGMNRKEVTAERRRNRKTTKKIGDNTDCCSTNYEDPLITLLLEKEEKYQTLLRSKLLINHPTLEEALTASKAFDEDFHKYTTPMEPGVVMNFAYWRAKHIHILVEWAKSFEVFSSLDREDKMRLIVHTIFSNLVLAEAFHTPERHLDRIEFPDGVCGFRNQSTNESSADLPTGRSGLTSSLVGIIDDILIPIRRMKLTRIEYLLLQAIIFYDPECLSLSLKSISLISAKRRRLLESLRKHIEESMNDISEAAARFANILLRISNIQKVSAFKRETLATIETLNIELSPNRLIMEISRRYPTVSFF